MRALRLLVLVTACIAAGVGSTGAQGRDIKAEPGGKASAPAGFYANSWALVIGINKYRQIPGLAYAVADAKAVADALPGLGFPAENIRLLLDRQATKARIESVLYRDFAGMGSDDRLFVFFAGHGETLAIRGGEEGYLLPVDVDPNALPLTAIPMDDVKRISQRLKGKHYLFVFDACFSGFATTRDIAPRRTTDEYLAAALREPVVQVLTAGRKGEQAIEDGGHGLFTRRLLDGLRGLADSEGRGLITAAQLAAWIEPRVVRDSKGKMTPQYGKLDGEGQFVFLRPPTLAAVTPPKIQIQEEVRQRLGSLAVSASLEDVDVWLDEQQIGKTKAGRALVVTNVVEGTHRLRARRPGHKDWERDVQVAANQRIEVVIDIEPLRDEPGKISKGDDGSAVPFLNEKGRAEYKKFLTTEYSRAFAIAEGGGSGQSSKRENRMQATASALYNCNKSARNVCRVYTVNDDVVYSRYAAFEERSRQLLKDLARERFMFSQYGDELVDYRVPSTDTVRREDYHADTPLSLRGVNTVKTVDLVKMMVSHAPPILVDALGGDGHRTLPGAYWIRDAGFGGSESTSADIRDRLGVVLTGLTRGNKAAPIVFFCVEARCWLSYNAALRARDLGYTAVHWYRGGTKAWGAAKLELLDAVQYGQVR